MPEHGKRCSHCKGLAAIAKIWLLCQRMDVLQGKLERIERTLSVLELESAPDER